MKRRCAWTFARKARSLFSSNMSSQHALGGVKLAEQNWESLSHTWRTLLRRTACERFGWRMAAWIIAPSQPHWPRRRGIAELTLRQEPKGARSWLRRIMRVAFGPSAQNSALRWL